MFSPRSRHLAVLTALTPLIFTFGCGPRYSDQEIVGASQHLAHLYDLRNYERANLEGARWKDAGPRAYQPRAWYVLNTARFSSDDDLSDSTVAWGEAMVKVAPQDPWSWFALAGALNYHRSRGKEAVAATDSMIRLSSDLPFLRLRVDVVRDQVSDSASLALIDSLPPSVQSNSVMLVRRAVAEYYRGTSAHNDSLREAAMATFARARAADSTNVEAWYLAGAYLSNQRRMEEAYPLLEAATRLTNAPDVHRTLWQAIQGRRDLSPDEKKEAIKADAETFMQQRGDIPSTLQAVASIYKTVGLKDEGQAIGDKLLSESPNSAAAEWILVDRYRDLARDIYEEKQQTGKNDPVKQGEYRKMLEAFIARPTHAHKVLLGDAYRSLFMLNQQFLSEDSVVDGDYLYGLVQGMVDYEGINPHIIYGAGAVALADDSTHLEQAERIAREGIAEAKKKIDEQHDHGVYETEGDYQRSLGRYTGIMYDALGWVYFAQGRVDMAEDTLLHAVDLDPKNMTTLNHLGRLYERRARGDTASPYLDSAQAVLIRGAMVQNPGTNPNDAALKDLYEMRHGSPDGWEAFRADIEEIDRGRRRSEVVADREKDPEQMTDFALASLSRGQVDSKRLRGKVLVVNYWGTWCGPCVAEMPEFQKFHEKYRNDPGVAVVTIDNDPNPDDVRTWMTKHKYDFPVLLDDGYVSKAGIHAFPTTWFVDPTGRIDFVKVGWSESLAEEFGWRVEALRKGS
jgi:thiol-disulfide isomerase/thioredoxin/Flp pilus assembly protein TadD